MASLTAFDFALAGIVLLSALAGLFRGLFREALSLVVWALALWVAYRHAEWLVPYLARWLANDQMKLWVARLGLFMATLVAGSIVSALLSLAVRGSGLSEPDRMLGMLFGLLRGVLLAGVTVIVLRLAGFAGEPWWQGSKLLPYAAPVADALRDAAEHGFGRSWSLASPPRPEARGGLPRARSW